jgi:hypothetical protein
MLVGWVKGRDTVGETFLNTLGVLRRRCLSIEIDRICSIGQSGDRGFRHQETFRQQHQLSLNPTYINYGRSTGFNYDGDGNFAI